MAMKLKDLLEVWEYDSLYITFYFCDGTIKEVNVEDIDFDITNFSVFKIDADYTYQDGKVDVYVKEHEKTRDSIFKKSFALMHEKGVLLSEDRSYAIFTNLEDAEKELKNLKELGGRGFFIEEVNIEFKESEVTK